MKKIILLTLTLFQFSLFKIHSEPAKVIVIKSKQPLQFLVDSLKVNSQKLRILISKSGYELSVWSDSIKIKSYPVVFGKNPVDDKLREGDYCTPEGKFKLISKYPHSWWSKFIWFDYPNEGSRIKHADAKNKGKIPANARIGGEVGIHGVPEDCDYLIDERKNWTWGCISLKTKDINEIYPYFNKNTVIEIRK